MDINSSYVQYIKHACLAWLIQPTYPSSRTILKHQNLGVKNPYNHQFCWIVLIRTQHKPATFGEPTFYIAILHRNHPNISKKYSGCCYVFPFFTCQHVPSLYHQLLNFSDCPIQFSWADSEKVFGFESEKVKWWIIVFPVNFAFLWIYYEYLIFLDTPLWGVPKMGVPLNHHKSSVLMDVCFHYIPLPYSWMEPPHWSIAP